MASKELMMPVLDGHAADEPTLKLLYALVLLHRPALVVEAGTYQGHAAGVMGMAMRDAGIDGEVWTADIKDYGAWANMVDNQLTNIVTCFAGDFQDMLEGPLKGRKIRMAFIDSGLTVHTTGDELYEPAVRVRHTQVAVTNISPGGLIIVDDMSGDWVGVEEVRKRCNILLTHGRGLGLVQS